MTTFRIHPSIGFARVGNSDQYNLAPETMAALPPRVQNSGTLGGLPLRLDNGEPITSEDVRDKDGRLKRQAARFKIFAYEHNDQLDRYPTGAGKEITIGSPIGDSHVKDIIWTVHVANKKANSYLLEAPGTTAVDLLSQYENGRTPPLRNVGAGPWSNNPDRVRKLTIDFGPRAINKQASHVIIGKGGRATYGVNGAIKIVENYPKSFPDNSLLPLYEPSGSIDMLGELRTDEHGRLHVVGAFGKAVAWYQPDSREHYPLTSDVDNDGWFDDTADGPVNAILVLENGEHRDVTGAWVVSTDPGFAPQTLNVISLWDDIYDTWVRKLGLERDLYDKGKFNKKYMADFYEQIYPIFQAARVQRWNTNLPRGAIEAHEAVGQIEAGTKPSTTILAGLKYIRDPNKPEQNAIDAPLMPLSLGDSGQSMLSVSKTQYFFLQQWDDEHFAKRPAKLGDGEYLDKASLINCLGGRFSPGIDMTFPVRDPDAWADRRTHGPFRVRQKALDYTKLPQDGLPLLSEGYVPRHSRDGLEPGDHSKFMSVPWHTDYNSCATHEPNPNLPENTTLYWSWPAQRPVAVYVATDLARPRDTSRPRKGGSGRGEPLPGQRWSLRGPGTTSQDLAKTGRFQNREDIITNWWKIGTIMQRTQIVDPTIQGVIEELPEGTFLEVASRFENDGPFVPPWPINAEND